jgi:hypothetical protein
MVLPMGSIRGADCQRPVKPRSESATNFAWPRPATRSAADQNQFSDRGVDIIQHFLEEVTLAD